MRSKSTPLETVILFSAGRVRFALAAEAVEEIRDIAGLQRLGLAISDQKFAKVTHTLVRNERNHFVVDACVQFGMRSEPASRLMLLRHASVAVMVDAVDGMQEIHSIQVLPAAFQGEERTWYRGLTLVKGRVVPIVNPGAFLSKAEVMLLESALRQVGAPRGIAVTA